MFCDCLLRNGNADPTGTKSALKVQRNLDVQMRGLGGDEDDADLTDQRMVVEPVGNVIQTIHPRSGQDQNE